MALEFSIRLAGSVLCEGRPADPDNCILLQSVSGLDGRERRMQVEAVAGADGDVFGPATRAGITLGLEALIVGSTAAALRTREQALRAALEPADAGSTTLVEVLGRSGDPAGGLSAQMRVIAPLRAPDRAEDGRVKAATWALAAEAATWDGAAHVVSVTPYTQDGLVFPFVFPLSFATTSGSGTAVVNAGNARAWPALVLYGYSYGPVIENLTTGEELSFGGLEIPAGDSLTIQTRPGSRSALLGGITSVYGELDRATSAWWGLAPGTNMIRMSDVAHDGTARLDVIYSDAYL